MGSKSVGEASFRCWSYLLYSWDLSCWLVACENHAGASDIVECWVILLFHLYYILYSGNYLPVLESCIQTCKKTFFRLNSGLFFFVVSETEQNVSLSIPMFIILEDHQKDILDIDVILNSYSWQLHLMGIDTQQPFLNKILVYKTRKTYFLPFGLWNFLWSWHIFGVL